MKKIYKSKTLKLTTIMVKKIVVKIFVIGTKKMMKLTREAHLKTELILIIKLI